MVGNDKNVRDETPRQRRQEKTRRLIKDEALRMVREGGIAALSLRELARRVDYSPAALYEYFDSREALLGELAREGYERLGEALRAPEGLRPLARLGAMCRGYLSFAARSPEHFLLVFTDLPGTAPDWAAFRAASPSYEWLVEAVRDGLESGELEDPAGHGPVGLAFGVWGLVHGLSMLRATALRGLGEDLSPAQEAAVDAHLKGLSARRRGARR